MKEYRVRAYFTDSSMYPSRTYKRKIYMTLPDALNALNKAKVYYSSYKYIDKVVIESREVTNWTV